MPPPPNLSIPSSTSTVSVSIIDTTSTLNGVLTSLFLGPPIVGHNRLDVPCFSFLIQHPSNRSLIFDLGIRRDWENLAPPLAAGIEGLGATVAVKDNVVDILNANGVDTARIEAVIWSHHHFDHIGDTSTFPSSTKLIVGPGFKDGLLPGYPANPESFLLESDYTGRELIELDFSAGLKVGRFEALDYFGDGSFYLLNTPGHAIGHICGLARVASGASDEFILMAGDAYHHAGEIRPSEFQPLPGNIEPSPFGLGAAGGCPCALFKKVLREGRCDVSFYDPTGPWHHDAEKAKETAKKLQEFDAQENVFLVAAHDTTLLGVVDLFPKQVTGSLAKVWDQKSRWKFLTDFSEAVGKSYEWSR
ncbi:hypothetical protein OQA88_11861 [Cercophora sp. LCS_1]